MNKAELAKIPIGAVVKIQRGPNGPAIDAELTGGLEQILSGSWHRAPKIWTVEVKILDVQERSAWRYPRSRWYPHPVDKGSWRKNSSGPLDEPFRLEGRYVRDLEADAERARQRAAERQAERARVEAEKQRVEENERATLLACREQAGPGAGNSYLTTRRSKTVVAFEDMHADAFERLDELVGRGRVIVLVELNDEGLLPTGEDDDDQTA